MDNTLTELVLSMCYFLCFNNSLGFIPNTVVKLLLQDKSKRTIKETKFLGYLDHRYTIAKGKIF
ncbi:hypothetical protein SAMN05421807_11573 [Virgibacillus chiguensis]|uniref:Uncharacterized protein n=1 Tax=Virgibacillus chiguensis TaxID=411959 RepID=A0A1M5W9M4_9BACI|nr:hypothetical protein SAMN05421807_11573 [Virgibacillus chiguensis]